MAVTSRAFFSEAELVNSVSRGTYIMIVRQEDSGLMGNPISHRFSALSCSVSIRDD